MSYTSARPQRRRRPSPSGQAGRTPTAQPAAAGPELTTVSTPRTEIRSFAELGLAPELLRILTQQGIEAPFPIQQATLPDALSGRDVLGRGRTGSGKTLAFGLPLVQRLTESAAARQPKRPRALILVPTRELANQVHATLQPLAASLGLRTAVIFGGVGRAPRPPPCGPASTFSSPARDGWRTCWISASAISARSRSPCSTKPTTWLTWASCRRSAGSWTRPPPWPAAAVLGHARQGRQCPGHPLPVQPGDPLGRLGGVAGQHDDPPRVRGRSPSQVGGDSGTGVRPR